MKNIKDLFEFDKNCLLCKYKYDKEACSNETYDSNFHCPSLSNIYHGKLVKLFPFNMIEKLKDNYEEVKAEKFYADFNEDGTENSTMKHIFGISSYMDLSPMPCGLLSMNDFDVTYLKDKNKYILGVETALWFDDDHGKYEYVKWTLDKFTEFMEQNGYDTTKEFELYEVFTKGININSEFDSIEECYAAFKMFVNGFCSLEKEEPKVCRFDDKCVTDRSLCDDCKFSPKYDKVPTWDHLQEYIPACPQGYKDCVNDPAYIKHHHPKWYQELYGDMTPEEASKECDESCCYDDEDK